MASSPSRACCSVDVSSVSASDRAAWCAANLDTCGKLCGGSIAPNTCDTGTLDWVCRCSSGLEPDLSAYANTVPSLECKRWQSEFCTSGSTEIDCQASRCGSKSVQDDADSSSGSSALASASATAAASNDSSGTSRASSTTLQGEMSTRTSSPLTTATGSADNGGSLGGGGSNGGSNGGGLSTGAKAGIAVGAILGVFLLLVLFFLLRRIRGSAAKAKAWKGKEPQEPYEPSDEKQVAVPIAEEISMKPELHGESGVPGADMPEVVDQNSNSQYQYPNSAQWQQSQNPLSELDSSNAVPAELHSSSRSPELGDNTASISIPSATAEPRSQISDRSPSLTSSTESKSPAPTTRSAVPLSVEEIEALEEEERRLDEEMAEVQRMKELREQKFAIQQKLRDAKQRI